MSQSRTVILPQHTASPPPPQSPIVVKLKNWDVNTDQIRASKLANKTDSDNKSKVFIGKHLTNNAAALLKKTKSAQKDGKLHIVWVHDGKVFIQKIVNGRKIRISKEDDLQETVLSQPSEKHTPQPVPQSSSSNSRTVNSRQTSMEEYPKAPNKLAAKNNKKKLQAMDQGRIHTR